MTLEPIIPTYKGHFTNEIEGPWPLPILRSLVGQKRLRPVQVQFILEGEGLRAQRNYLGWNAYMVGPRLWRGLWECASNPPHCILSCWNTALKLTPLRAISHTRPLHLRSFISWKRPRPPSSLHTRRWTPTCPKKLPCLKKFHINFTWHIVNNVSWSTGICIKTPLRDSPQACFDKSCQFLQKWLLQFSWYGLGIICKGSHMVTWLQPLACVWSGPRLTPTRPKESTQIPNLKYVHDNSMVTTLWFHFDIPNFSAARTWFALNVYEIYLETLVWTRVTSTILVGCQVHWLSQLVHVTTQSYAMQ